jgi:four helix bundle protein
MSTYKRFEDLPVWKKAADLAALMFQYTRHESFRGKGDLANQLQRATLSISNNVAEGFERGSTAELLQYLYIARGSAGEVRSMLRVMERMDEFAPIEPSAASLVTEFESVSRQLRAWAASLQNSEIQGQRHLNDKTRQDYANQQRRTKAIQDHAAFRLELEERLKREAESKTAANDR